MILQSSDVTVLLTLTLAQQWLPQHSLTWFYSAIIAVQSGVLP